MGRGMSADSRRLIARMRDILTREHPSGVRRMAYALYGNRAGAEVKRVGRLLTLARKQGVIPWEWIADDTRPEREPFVVDDMAALRSLNRSCPSYDPWRDQPVRVWVWSEKSVGGTLAPVLDKYLVPFQIHHGNTSSTVMRSVAERTWDDGRNTAILYVGDHDPKGLRISEDDLPTRLDAYGAERIRVERVALTRADVQALRGLADSFKPGDTDVAWYRERTGLSYGVELEAIPSTELRARVEQAIRSHIVDVNAWNRTMAASRTVRESWEAYVAQWPAPPAIQGLGSE